MMKSLFALGAGIVALATALPAQAATFNITLVGGSAGFTNTLTSPGLFADIYNFTVSDPNSIANSFVAEIVLPFGSDITFSGIDLDGIAFTQTAGGGPNQAEVWTLASTPVGVGPHAITVSGTSNASANSGATYIGSINVQSVPEPTTWMMMIGGFAMVGMAIRRRAKVSVAYN